MKLFAKYNRINIAASIAVFLAGCLAFYFVFRYVLTRQIDESLRTEQTEINQYVKEHNQLPEIVEAYDQKISYQLVDKPVQDLRFISQKVKTEKRKRYEDEWIRLLVFGVAVNGKQYEIRVSKSEMETEDLLILILLIAAGMTGLILVMNYFINAFFIRRLWKPFYQSIHAVQQYRLSGQQNLQLPADPIDEFDLLNKSINSMASRIHADYNILKEFTSNAAHEMQTPLAVIINSIDAIIQQEPLLHLVEEPIFTIQKSADKLIRLNQALLLLTRMENRQFESKEEIRADLLVEHKCNELKELITVTGITMEISVVPVTVYLHKYLAEIVFDNLLHNAIRYNIEQGFISIELTERCFSISNASAIPPLDPAKVFQRFYRHPETGPGGNGLGLSIVKQICDLAGYPIHYRYQNTLHTISIAWK
ncbi:MAG: HAMP domain-containing histidine kinase [Williamsia sp.]|nr:HAMP domain-containing histidine kinase [Williamsia sp.]